MERPSSRQSNALTITPPGPTSTTVININKHIKRAEVSATVIHRSSCPLSAVRHQQRVALTERNTTGPPCSCGAIIRIEAAWRHCPACAGEAACRPAVECYRRRQTPATVTSLAPYIMCRRALITSDYVIMTDVKAPKENSKHTGTRMPPSPPYLQEQGYMGPTKGRLGWVDTAGCLHTRTVYLHVYTHPNTNPARCAATLLSAINALRLAAIYQY